MSQHEDQFEGTLLRLGEYYQEDTFRLQVRQPYLKSEMQLNRRRCTMICSQGLAETVRVTERKAPQPQPA